MLSVALVVVTTVTVGVVLTLLIPDLGWPLALATGAVVAPPDAVAATAVGRRIGLPRGVVTILEAESLLNDATALVALRTAIAAISGGVEVASIGLDFVVAAGGGILVGLAVFLLLGLQAPSILAAVADSDLSVGRIALVCAATVITVIVTRLVWVVVTETIHDARRSPTYRTPMSDRIVIGWAGMRGVVTVAAALLIPVDAPYRDVLILVALSVVFGTLFLQDLSLPWVARRLKVRGPDPAADALARATLLQQAAVAGLDRMESAEIDDATGVCDLIRARIDQRSFAAWERPSTTAGHETPSEIYARVRLDMLEAERERVLAIRDKGKVPSDIVREVLAMLDIEESMIEVGSVERQDIEPLVWEIHGPGCPDLQVYPAGECMPDPVCARCAEEGGHPVALRQCLVCGNIGCCDSSVGQHATAHFEETGHPVMQSAEPGENWRWCYVHHFTG